MGILDSFERGIERAVNGAFARTFRSGLQPVEITSAIRREMDTHAAPVARDRILVPNHFTVRVSEGDHLAMSSLGEPLMEELTDLAATYAREHGYQMLAPPVIELIPDESLAIGMLEVASKTERVDVAWGAFIELDGKRYPVDGTVVIGRGSEADVTIDDPGISRKHLEISWDGKRAVARDLGSTNGTKLNGERISRVALANGTVLQVGRTVVTFRLIAQAAR